MSLLSPPKPVDFTPPSPRQVQEHLERNPAIGHSRAATWAPLVALVAAVIIAMTAPPGPAAMLPWLIILGLLFYSAARVRRARDLEARAARIQELALLRRHAMSLRLAWKLLPHVGRNPELHMRTVAIMALNMDLVGAAESSLVAYQYLLERLPKGHPGIVQIQVQAALAQLASDHLLDADATLRRLRDLDNAKQSNVATATYHLALLAQQVCTHHDADALPLAQGLVQKLQPLGVDAGYGYALMALAHHRVGQRQAEDGGEIRNHAPATAAWWSKATLLLPVDALTGRYRELEVLTADATLAGAVQRATPPQ